MFEFKTCIPFKCVKKFFLFISIILSFSLGTAFAGSPDTHVFRPFLYFGPSIGYGSTNWQLLVATDDLAQFSAPSAAKDNGGVVGGVLGFQFTPQFALEADYMHFSDSFITFHAWSIYCPDCDNDFTIRSHTSALSLFGKFTIPFAKYFAAFANAGVEITFRKDSLANKTNPGGVFGIGLEYFFSKYVLTQLAFQFYTGYGKSESKPAVDFIPFLWQIHAIIAYRIQV